MATNPDSHSPGLSRVLLVVALLLYVGALLGAFGWLFHDSILRTLGLIAAGLACSAASRLGV